MKEQKQVTAEPIGSAAYIKTVYGVRTFARAVSIEDSQSIMDLMDDFSAHNCAPLQARIKELEQRNTQLELTLERFIDLSKNVDQISTAYIAQFCRAALNQKEGKCK